jgi:hypothetical protein
VTGAAPSAAFDPRAGERLRIAVVGGGVAGITAAHPGAPRDVVQAGRGVAVLDEQVERGRHDLARARLLAPLPAGRALCGQVGGHGILRDRELTDGSVT